MAETPKLAKIKQAKRYFALMAIGF